MKGYYTADKPVDEPKFSTLITDKLKFLKIL